MSTKVSQYTIRGIPQPVDAYLRKKVRLTGRSLNQVIIDELSEKAGLGNVGNQRSLVESLGWFIGSGMDQDVADALAEEDRIQKQLAARELKAFQAGKTHDS